MKANLEISQHFGDDTSFSFIELLIINRCLLLCLYMITTGCDYMGQILCKVIVITN